MSLSAHKVDPTLVDIFLQVNAKPTVVDFEKIFKGYLDTDYNTNTFSTSVASTLKKSQENQLSIIGLLANKLTEEELIKWQ